MRRKHIALFLVAISLLFSAAGAERTALQEKAGNLGARIKRIENGLIPNPGFVLKGEAAKPVSLLSRMADYKVPGVSVAVIKDHEIEWAKGYGLKEAGGSGPVTPETLFQAASISKPVSAMAALYFVGQGLLNLDENVNDKLLSWKVPDNEWTKDKKVTLRGILIF
jgi:CubicO group peptidase (beta-lactamase class C family)